MGWYDEFSQLTHDFAIQAQIFSQLSLSICAFPRHKLNSAENIASHPGGSFCWHPGVSALSTFSVLQTLWRSKSFDDKAPLLRLHKYVSVLGSPLIFSSNTWGFCLLLSTGWVAGSVCILFMMKTAETPVQGLRVSRLKKAAPTLAHLGCLCPLWIQSL